MAYIYQPIDLLAESTAVQREADKLVPKVFFLNGQFAKWNLFHFIFLSFSTEKSYTFEERAPTNNCRRK